MEMTETEVRAKSGADASARAPSWPNENPKKKRPSPHSSGASGEKEAEGSGGSAESDEATELHHPFRQMPTENLARLYLDVRTRMKQLVNARDETEERFKKMTAEHDVLRLELGKGHNLHAALHDLDADTRALVGMDREEIIKKYFLATSKLTSLEEDGKSLHKSACDLEQRNWNLRDELYRREASLNFIVSNAVGYVEKHGVGMLKGTPMEALLPDNCATAATTGEDKTCGGGNTLGTSGSGAATATERKVFLSTATSERTGAPWSVVTTGERDNIPGGGGGLPLETTKGAANETETTSSDDGSSELEETTTSGDDGSGAGGSGSGRESTPPLIISNAEESGMPFTIEEAMQPSEEARIITDIDGTTIRYVNEPWERLCGYTASEVAGKTIKRLIQGPETEYAIVKALAHAVMRQGACAEAKLTNYRKDGTKFTNRLTVAPVHSEQHGRMFLGVLRLFDPAKEAEERRRSRSKSKSSAGRKSVSPPTNSPPSPSGEANQSSKRARGGGGEDVGGKVELSATRKRTTRSSAASAVAKA